MFDIDTYLAEKKNSSFFLIAFTSPGKNHLIWTGNGGTVTLSDHNDLAGVTPLHRRALKGEFEKALAEANSRNLRGDNLQVQIVEFPPLVM